MQSLDRRDSMIIVSAMNVAKLCFTVQAGKLETIGKIVEY